MSTLYMHESTICIETCNSVGQKIINKQINEMKKKIIQEIISFSNSNYVKKIVRNNMFDKHSNANFG